MPSSLVPLSEAPAAPVNDYLQRQGITPGIVAWKYFDTRFNRGSERGYVLLRDGRVSGFLGAVPFRMCLNGRSIETAWSCDWSCDPDAGASGILLMKQMLAKYDPYFNLGGNENTLRILPRLASFSLRDAGVLMYTPLRAGALLERARRLAPRLPLDGAALLNRLPLGMAPGRSALTRVCVERGVADRLAGLLARSCPGRCHPQYDFEYVDWQIGRCPEVEATTVSLPTSAEPPAAALCWRQKPAGRSWRIALWAVEGAQRERDTVLCGALRHIYQAGGEIASMLVSRLDADLRSLLKARHFFAAPRRRMFCALSSDRSQKFEEPSGFSFLDTDVGYRF